VMYKFRDSRLLNNQAGIPLYLGSGSVGAQRKYTAGLTYQKLL